MIQNRVKVDNYKLIKNMKKKRDLFTQVKIVKQPNGKDSAILLFTDYHGEPLMVGLRWSCPMARDVFLIHKEKVLEWFNREGFKKWARMMTEF